MYRLRCNRIYSTDGALVSCKFEHTPGASSTTAISTDFPSTTATDASSTISTGVTSTTSTGVTSTEGDISTTNTVSTTLAPKARCGIKGRSQEDSEGKIVGGTLANKCEYPWQVFILADIYLCGGSIVDEDTILTAAHCLESPADLSADDITVYIGEYDVTDSTDHITIPVERFLMHKDYKPTNFQNDIAIIKLKRPMEFNDCIAPICLPELGANYSGLSCDVSGWGTTKFDGNTSDKLRKVTLPIVDQSECVKAYSSSYVTDMNLCAGFKAGGKDSCQGDSGGPLACPKGGGVYVLAGVVSSGKGCAEPDIPGVYTNVVQYLDWIQNNS